MPTRTSISCAWRAPRSDLPSLHDVLVQGLGRGEPVGFHIKNYLINGDLPIFNGLASRKQMGANHSFRFRNLPLVVQNTIYSLDLIYHFSRFLPPLQESSNYYCVLFEKKSLSKTVPKISKHRPSVQDRHYPLPGTAHDKRNIDVSSIHQNYLGQKGNNSDYLTDKCEIDTI